MGKSDGVILQVQIVAYGEDGIRRVAAHRHPKMEGVQWTVSWQIPEGEGEIPEELSERDDFDISIISGKGVSKNRNNALDYPCVAPYVLLSDDDVDYTEEGLGKVIEAFKEHPDADLLCFRYRCNGEYVKNYGEGVYNLDKTPFGWYPTTFEMAFRRENFKNVRFNENVGPGSGKLISGEDTVWYADMRYSGAKGYIIPEDICEHNQSTTGERMATDPDFLFAHGACVMHLKPITWFPRLLLHAWRTPMPYFKCLKQTLRGAVYAYREGIFR